MKNKGHIDFGEDKDGVHLVAVHHHEDGTIDMETSDGKKYIDCKLKSWESPEVSGVTTVEMETVNIEKINALQYKINGKTIVTFDEESMKMLGCPVEFMGGKNEE